MADAAALHGPTLRVAIRKLEYRLNAVATYGAGGCPTCHDAELRSAIAMLKQIAATEGAQIMAAPTPRAVRR
jgi:hypothetical protein